MLPGNILSSQLEYATFIPPDDILVDGTVDYELGGVGLSDASQGLQVQVWTARITGTPGFPGTAVTVEAPNTPATQLFAMDGISEISLAFDQNMKPFIAFVASGVAQFWWYDATLPGTRFTTLPVGSTSPKCTLDDKRPLENLLGTTDILVVYLLTDNLYFRMQRDRYTVEYLLYSDVSARLISPRVNKVAMNNVDRVQFLLYGSLYP